MKKFLGFLLLWTSVAAYAEDILQVVPLQTTAGVAYKDKKMIEISLSNTFNVANLQFDLLLPEGMAISSNNSEFTERAQTYDEDEDDYVNNFTWTQNVVSSGYTRIVFTPTTLNPIEAGSGTILKLRYKTDASMADGVYPILMEEIELDKSVTESVKHLKAVSYVVIGETSPLQTEANVNLSTLTGYIPSFVVESLNEEFAANDNLSSLNLSGVTELGAELAVPENVVYAVGSTGGLKRTFDAGKKSTVCLPFGLDAAQVAAIKDGGCEVEKLKSYHADKGIVSFEPVSEMEANTPYLVKSETAKAVFDGMEGVTITDFQPTIDVTAEGGLSMIGSFERKTISSDETISYYAYDAADGSFVRIGKNATVYPFRAYLALSGTAPARLYIGDDDTTDIDVNRQASLDGDTFNLQGMKVNTVEKGIYIKNHKKYIGK